METMGFESILLPGVEAKRPIVIAGPCSAETEEQVLTTAKQLSDRGIKIFRAGIWKPRTRPGAFEGIGSEGFEVAQASTIGIRHVHRHRGGHRQARH